jgi:hypothetical protein
MPDRRIFPVLLLLLAAGAVEAQPAAEPKQEPAVQREAMKRLDNWAGNWRGSGWILTGPSRTRQEFTITETVQSKLGGRVLLVEGLGRGKDPASGAEVDVHVTLAVLSYDEKAQVYRFRTHEAAGRALDAQAQPTDSGLEWGFRDEATGATIRFTIRLDGNRWHEVGEATRDGKTWHKFLEMTLERQAS